jgi:chemotaxis protein methyltransferase CheR
MEEALLKQARTLIANQTGLLVSEQDDAMLRKVVDERVRALKLPGVEQYCQFLGSDAGILHEREALVIPLTTGETYFFRDTGQQHLLKDKIFPELLERRKKERSLRVWSAACSTGEEVYSLAILLDELMAEQSQWHIFILGTDINHHAIDKARRGIYTEWSFRGVSNERRQRYFHRHKDTWELDERIRRRVIFQTGDLVADEFPGHSGELYDMDLILCRNTFIYMPPPVTSRIADKFTQTLTDGGILMTGHGELYAHHLGQLRARVFAESIVYQKAVAPFLSQKPAARAESQRPARQKKVAISPVEPKARAAAPVPQPRQATAETGKEESFAEMLRAWQYANEGQREKAAKTCSEMIARNPLDADPHYLLALLAQERGDSAAAKALLKKVIYLDHAFIAAYLDLGDLYAREGDGARAVKMRSTACELLKKRPGDEVVKLYGSSTVDDVLHYIENLLNAERA